MQKSRLSDTRYNTTCVDNFFFYSSRIYQLLFKMVEGNCVRDRRKYPCTNFGWLGWTELGTRILEIGVAVSNLCWVEEKKRKRIETYKCHKTQGQTTHEKKRSRQKKKTYSIYFEVVLYTYRKTFFLTYFFADIFVDWVRPRIAATFDVNTVTITGDPSK